VDPAGRLRTRRYGPGPEITHASVPLRVRAVGFDIDHTLGIDNKLERVAFLRLLDDICAAGGHALGTLADESARIDGLLERQRSGEFSIDQAVTRFASERGIAGGGRFAPRYKDTAIGSVAEFFVPQPDARMVLAQLHARRVPCAILTNGWSPLQQEKARRLDFDGPILVSDEIGWQKPQPQAFAALIDALGVPAAEIAFVGDNPRSDAAAAERSGMRAIWFDAEGIRYASDLPKPSAVIHSLTELLAFL
jgi:putative hydrolase of the HAD superfamily